MASTKTRREFGCIRQVDSSGRWQASYPNPQDKSRRINGPTTYATKDRAEAWLNDERRSIEMGTWKDPRQRGIDSKTLSEYGRGWLEDHPVRESTRALYRDRLEDHVYPHLGNRRLKSLTTSEIREWHRGRKRVAAQRSLETAYTALSAMLSTAVEDEIIDRNPCSIKGVYSTIPKRPTRAVTATELRLIAESMPPGYEAAILIAGWCGLRWGEVVALRRCDVNLRDGVLMVYQAFSVQRGLRETGAPRVGRAHSPAVFVRGNVKTDGSIRDVEIPPHVIPALTHHLDSHVGQSRDALLFPSVRSKKNSSDRSKNYPVSGSTFHKWFKSALEEAGVADMRFHELRHTAATLAMQTGQASGFDVMARLGHKSPRTAAMYQHSTGARQRGIADALSASAMREDPGLRQ